MFFSRLRFWGGVCPEVPKIRAIIEARLTSKTEPVSPRRSWFGCASLAAAMRWLAESPARVVQLIGQRFRCGPYVGTVRAIEFHQEWRISLAIDTPDGSLRLPALPLDAFLRCMLPLEGGSHGR